jgi:hypothetical protein
MAKDSNNSRPDPPAQLAMSQYSPKTIITTPYTLPFLVMFYFVCFSGVVVVVAGGTSRFNYGHLA